MVKISVIVPVYNVEKYLSRCIKSILGQSFTEFELILVDDGSSDASLEICKEFEKKDCRIRVLTGTNQGSSVARNKGLDIAQGEYVIYFDSDDWVESNILLKLYTHATKYNADICACGFVFDDGNGKQKQMKYPFSEEVHKDIYRLNSLFSSVWNKLVKRELYLKNDIKFVPGITMMDDWVVTTRLRYFSKKTVIVNDCLYHYYIAPRESITTNSQIKFPESQIKVVEFLENYFKDKINGDLSLRRAIEGIKLRAKYPVLKYKTLGGVKEWKKLFKDSHAYILSCSEPLKAKVIMILALILPSGVFSRIAYQRNKDR